MEAALIPPERLERIVLALIPPLAREAVAGDLCETYRNPRQYLREALRTVPFVIASQIRRNLNLPALLLQGALAWWLFGPPAVALAVPALMLREAWRPLARPSANRAIRETMGVALLAMVFLQSLSLDIGVMRQLDLSRATWMSLYFFGFLAAPLLCALRTGLIVSADRHALSSVAGHAALSDAYRAFARRTRRRHGIEAVALLAMAALLAAADINPALTVIFALAALYLLFHGAAEPAQTDFASLRALYRRELDRQRQLRRFLWWLWFAPLVLVLHSRMIQHGIAAGRPVSALLWAALALLLCFLVTALNSEHGGRTQEDIGALERMRETAPG